MRSREYVWVLHHLHGLYPGSGVPCNPKLYAVLVQHAPTSRPEFLAELVALLVLTMVCVEKVGGGLRRWTSRGSRRMSDAVGSRAGAAAEQARLGRLAAHWVDEAQPAAVHDRFRFARRGPRSRGNLAADATCGVVGRPCDPG